MEHNQYVGFGILMRFSAFLDEITFRTKTVLFVAALCVEANGHIDNDRKNDQAFSTLLSTRKLNIECEVYFDKIRPAGRYLMMADVSQTVMLSWSININRH